MAAGLAIWFTGLPGCGKSTIARTAVETLRAHGRDTAYLEMDARRKAYIPDPQYTPEERDKAYAMFVDEAAALTEQRTLVVMDGTAHRRRWRDLARERIPRFMEAHVDCDLETAIRREGGREGGRVMAGLYAKALERRRTGKEFPGLGQVPGVDEPYEKNPDAELTLDAERLGPDEAAARAVERILEYL